MCIYIIPDVNITLRLFYNMYGDDIRTLKVYSTKENRLFTKRGNQGKKWKNTSITTLILGSQNVSKILQVEIFKYTKLSKNINIYFMTLVTSSPVKKNSIFTRFFTLICHFLFFCNFLLLLFVKAVCNFYCSSSFPQT